MILHAYCSTFKFLREDNNGYRMLLKRGRLPFPSRRVKRDFCYERLQLLGRLLVHINARSISPSCKNRQPKVRFDRSRQILHQWMAVDGSFVENDGMFSWLCKRLVYRPLRLRSTRRSFAICCDGRNASMKTMILLHRCLQIVCYSRAH